MLAFELLPVPGVGQRRGMPSDPVDGIDHCVGKGHVGGHGTPDTRRRHPRRQWVGVVERGDGRLGDRSSLGAVP